MKQLPYYGYAEDSFDVDHEINRNVDNLKKQLGEIDPTASRKEKRLIIKAMMEILLLEL